MTSKERVITAMNHKEPDRVPVDFGGTVSNTGIASTTHTALLEYLGMKSDLHQSEIVDIFQQLTRPDQKLLDRFGADIYGLKPGKPDKWSLKIVEDSNSFFYTDEWGLKCRMPKEQGFYYDWIESPLWDPNLTVDDLKGYNWPDPRDPGRKRGIEAKVRRLNLETDYALCFTTVGSGVFEQSAAIRGNANFYIDLMIRPELAEAVMDKMMDFYLGYWEEMLPLIGEDVQIIKMGDDLGAQNGPLISPEVYRKMIKPREREIFSFIRKRTNAKLYFHSCGSIYEFIPDLIEIGVDILNPLQVSARDMDPARIKKEFGRDLTFWGAIDSQHVLPFGTPDEVKKEVKTRIKQLAPGGGYILSSVHNFQAKVPPENIATMFDSALEYGKYPIHETVGSKE